MLDNLDKFNKPQFGSATANFGMNTQPQSNPQYTPAMQAEINTDALKQAASDNFIAKRITAFDEVDPLAQMGLAIPVWAAMNMAMDKYLKHCGGDYHTSIPGKIGNFGDKVSGFFTNNPVARGIEKFLNKGKTAGKKYIYDNSGLLRAFDTTSSQPELTLVKHQFEGIKGMVANDCSPAWEAFLKPLKSAKDLDCLGASKADIQRVEALIKSAVTAEEKALILQAEEFRLLNPAASDKLIRNFKYHATPAQRSAILEELKIKAMGFANKAEFELLKGDAIKYSDRILQVLSKANKNMYARIGWSDANIGKKIDGNLLGRKVSFSELFNKLQSSKGAANTMHTSKLGRFLAKASNQVMEGATSRISGGKLMAFLQAYFLAEALIKANRQETTGDKLKSAAEIITELIGFFVFMPPSIKLMHKIGGLQYSGMTPQQVEAYRQAVKEFNEKVINLGFANKKEYKAARKALRAQFRPKTKNPFVWAARKCADILTVGLEQVRPYTRFKQKPVDLTITNIMKSPKQYFKNILPRLKDFACNPKYWMKQMAGYPMRFLFPMMLFVPFFNKIAVKGCHAIFGKPKYSLLDESKVEEYNAKLEEQQQMQAQAATRPRIITPVQTQNGVSTSNMLNQYRAQQALGAAQISHTGNLTPKKEKTEQKEDEKPPVKKYIPSPEGVKIAEQKFSSEVDLALKRADAAEKQAIDILGGKFA